MRLRTLRPQFLRVEAGGILRHVDALADADGIRFLCPKCYRTNGGPMSTHSVICWRPHVPKSLPPVPGRWEFEGTGYDDLTLVAPSSSIQLTSGCAWHGYVRAGKVVDA